MGEIKCSRWELWEKGQLMAGVKVNRLLGHWGTQPGQRALSLLPAFCGVGRGMGDLGHRYEAASLCLAVS